MLSGFQVGYTSTSDEGGRDMETQDTNREEPARWPEMARDAKLVGWHVEVVSRQGNTGPAIESTQHQALERCAHGATGPN